MIMTVTTSSSFKTLNRAFDQILIFQADGKSSDHRSSRCSACCLGEGAASEFNPYNTLRLLLASAVAFNGIGGMEGRAPIRAAVQGMSNGIKGGSAILW